MGKGGSCINIKPLDFSLCYPCFSFRETSFPFQGRKDTKKYEQIFFLCSHSFSQHCLLHTYILRNHEHILLGRYSTDNRGAGNAWPRPERLTPNHPPCLLFVLHVFLILPFYVSPTKNQGDFWDYLTLNTAKTQKQTFKRRKERRISRSLVQFLAKSGKKESGQEFFFFFFFKLVYL